MLILVSTVLGTEANGEEGAQYFVKACEYGFARGCSNAGILYLEGKRTKKDYEKGLKYMTLACEQGQAEACSVLGTGYLLRKYGLDRDLDKATELMKKGCELGSLAGCGNLSRMYRTGDGVERNDALAHRYMELAKKVRALKDGTNTPGIKLGRTN